MSCAVLRGNDGFRSRVLRSRRIPLTACSRRPFVWIGKVDEIAIKLHKAKDVLGVSRYVIRPSARADPRLVIDAITGA